jgi:CRISPR-associated protein Csb2
VRRREINGVLYALEGKLRPRVTATLEIAEQVRRRLMGIHRNLIGGDPRKVSSKFYQRGGKPDVRCIPIRWGALGDLLKPTGRFISATPFVPPLHYRKGRGDFAEWLLAQVRREAANRSLPEISRIAPVPRLYNQGKVVAWLDFRRNRKDDTVKPGYGFEIEFAQPVLPECGPMALGYGAHFGLGQFRTV